LLELASCESYLAECRRVNPFDHWYWLHHCCLQRLRTVNSQPS